jgi:hypothetical protein
VDLPVDALTLVSAQAIAMEAQIALATPNELLFSVKRLFINFTQVLTSHA